MKELLTVEFLRPAYFALAFFAVPAVAMLLREGKFWRYFRTAESSVSKSSLFHPLAIRAVCAALVIVGLSAVLADPRYPLVKQMEKRDGTDIVFVFDISKSMLAEDIVPNRMDAAKRVLANFVAKRQGDRFGLVIFAGKPFLLSPLTSDLEAFSAILSKVTTDSIHQEIPGLSGTNIGEALLLASETLTGTTSDKNVVLVTDGEANVGIDPKPVAKFLAERNVKIHSIGIGDPKGIDLYVTDKTTGEKTFFLGPDGKPIRAILDAELMAFISTTTSGTFANASDAAGLEKIFDALDRATKKESTMETVKRYSSAKMPFLLLVALSLLGFALMAGKVSDDPSA